MGDLLLRSDEDLESYVHQVSWFAELGVTITEDDLERAQRATIILAFRRQNR